MDLLIFFGIFLVSFLIYIIYTSYEIQMYLHSMKKGAVFIPRFSDQVKGIVHKNAYFAPQQKLHTKKDLEDLQNSTRRTFSRCYQAVSFKTADTDWELYFTLVREGMAFNEALTIRAFPRGIKIRSEGNVEKAFSRVNVLANNHYLATVLETPEMRDMYKWLMRETGDTLYVTSNNIHLRLVLKDKDMISVDRVLEMVHSLHQIKNRIFRRDVMEY